MTFALTAAATGHPLVTGAEAAAPVQVRQVLLRLLHVRVDLIQTLLNPLQLLWDHTRKRGASQKVW